MSIKSLTVKLHNNVHTRSQNLQTIINSEVEELAAEQKPAGLAHYRDLITYVTDRPGHDQRYAIDASKIAHELGWVPQETFESGMRKTVAWYLANPTWWQAILDGRYQGERLGLSQ